MQIWLVIALLGFIITALLIAGALRRRSGPSNERAQHELEVHRARLQEVDRDLQRGLLNLQEAQAARTEIGRSILQIEETQTAQAEKTGWKPAWGLPAWGLPAWGLIALALAVPLASLALYMLLGNPDLPGRPYADRQAEQQALAARQQAQQPLVELTEKLRARIDADPEDTEAWYGLGQAEVELGRYKDAVESLRRAARLDETSARFQAALAEALILANGGEIVPGAKQALEQALSLDPGNQRARFFSAIALSRDGRGEEALAELVDLLREAPAGASWRPAVLAAAKSLAQELGRSLPEDLTAAAPPAEAAAPDQDALSGLDESQLETIRGMVAGLASRLEQNPDDAEGWQRLGRSYQVLGQAEDSAEAYSKAADLLPDDGNAQTQAGMAWVRAAGQGGPLPDATSLYFKRALELDPQSIDALFFLGEGARQQGDAAAARDYWSRLLPLLPPESEVRDFVAGQLDKL